MKFAVPIWEVATRASAYASRRPSYAGCFEVLRLECGASDVRCHRILDAESLEVAPIPCHKRLLLLDEEHQQDLRQCFLSKCRIVYEIRYTMIF